ncbi:hypothetical protein LXT21_15775 [Myxococcus sp. K38C18041901]|uniref:hypothetical protein n=1 Tax=Myxococcus guangdongensis TaxID=2906760 RepID=UPI0020A75CCF|nr:hypothetical protein [Myxococcus guangdongensis]MCP3060241.1 hypothetical protein [Myxococcus guangdongensis]
MHHQFAPWMVASLLTLASTARASPPGEAAPPSAPILSYEASYLDAQPREFSLAPVSGAAIRYDGWSNVRGVARFTFWWPVIRRGSLVFISASEVDNSGNRFVGLAPFTVLNIAPKDGYVEFLVNVDWGSSLRISTDFLVINP